MADLVGKALGDDLHPGLGIGVLAEGFQPAEHLGRMV